YTTLFRSLRVRRAAECGPRDGQGHVVEGVVELDRVTEYPGRPEGPGGESHLFGHRSIKLAVAGEECFVKGGLGVVQEAGATEQADASESPARLGQARAPSPVGQVNQVGPEPLQEAVAYEFLFRAAEYNQR